MNIINETLSSIMPGDLVVFVYRRDEQNEVRVVANPTNPQVASTTVDGTKSTNRIDPSATSWLNEMLDFDRF